MAKFSKVGGIGGEQVLLTQELGAVQDGMEGTASAAGGAFQGINAEAGAERALARAMEHDEALALFALKMLTN